MQHLPTIAVIGGTGKSGRYLVQELLNHHYPLRLLHRHPETLNLQHPSLEIVKGDARDEEGIMHLLRDCSAVISTLGQPGKEPPVFSQATANIIAAMKTQQINRYIVTTGLSVITPQDHKSKWVQTATDWMYQHYPATTKDKQAEYELLQQSTILWTMIRLPLITFTGAPGRIAESLTDCPGQNIHAVSLAAFLIQQLQSERYHCCAPFIANIS